MITQPYQSIVKHNHFRFRGWSPVEILERCLLNIFPISHRFRGGKRQGWWMFLPRLRENLRISRWTSRCVFWCYYFSFNVFKVRFQSSWIHTQWIQQCDVKVFSSYFELFVSKCERSTCMQLYTHAVATVCISTLYQVYLILSTPLCLQCTFASFCFKMLQDSCVSRCLHWLPQCGVNLSFWCTGLARSNDQ